MTSTLGLGRIKNLRKEKVALYNTLLGKFNQDKDDSLKGSCYQKQPRLEAAVEKPRVRKAVQKGEAVGDIAAALE